MNWNEIIKRVFSLYGVKSQQALADKLGISQDTISRWVTGKARPDWEKLQEIALKQKVALSWLLFGQGEQAPPLEPTDEGFDFGGVDADELAARLKRVTRCGKALTRLSCLPAQIAAGAVSVKTADQLLLALEETAAIVETRIEKAGQRQNAG